MKKQKKNIPMYFASILFEKSSLFKITNRLERSFFDTEYAGSLYRQILFLEFMIHLNRAALKNRVEFLDTSLYNPKVVDLIQYINQHLTEPLDIDFLASRVYLSKYYMMRLFQNRNRIYHWKLYYLPQAFICPCSDSRRNADHTGMSFQRFSGLLLILPRIQIRISRTSEDTSSSL